MAVPSFPSPPPPPGLIVSARASTGEFSIRRRWARPKHAFFVLAIGALDAFLVTRWMAVSERGAELAPVLVLGSIFALSLTARLLAALLNETRVEVGTDAVRVHHGPLPSIVFRPACVARHTVRAFEARQWGPHYEVVAVEADGARRSLVRPLVTRGQADYVRDALRTAWALPEGDAPLEPAGATDPAAGSKGARGVVAFVLVFVAAFLALFYSVSSADIEGSVSIGAGPASVTFTPTDCRSGVPRGFFGVELTSEEMPGTIVRVVRDPTRGSMLALERAGGMPEVFGPGDCASLNLEVEQTTTNINDVWVLRGSARAQCEGLTLDVRYDGCH